MLSWRRLLKVPSHSQTVDCFAEKERREGGREAEKRKKQLFIWISSDPKRELVAHCRSLPVVWLQMGIKRRGSVQVRLHIYGISLDAKQKSQLTVAAPTQGYTFGWRGVGRRERSYCGSFDHCLKLHRWQTDGGWDTHGYTHILYKKIKVKKQDILIRKIKIERNRSLPRREVGGNPITGCSAGENSLALLAERRVGPSSLQSPWLCLVKLKTGMHVTQHFLIEAFQKSSHMNRRDVGKDIHGALFVKKKKKKERKKLWKWVNGPSQGSWTSQEWRILGWNATQWWPCVPGTKLRSEEELAEF